ncbi:hypothetical protein MMC28_008770 [Mycoblastus sanguinarius]|nr:hypothetical protein [Mycoblastus sanguinarius]
MIGTKILQHLLPFYLIPTSFALSPNPRQQSLPPLAEINNTRSILAVTQSNQTFPGPLPPRPVDCFGGRWSRKPTLSEVDCSYILNDVILRLDGVFDVREFSKRSYKSNDLGYLPARWEHGKCYISVVGVIGDALLTLFDVALSANRVLSECATNKKGGVTDIGSLQQGYHVSVGGLILDAGSDTGDDISVPPSPNVKTSKRSIESHSASNTLPRRSLHLTQPNTTTPPRYPVQCFNPHLVPLPPADATDCFSIITTILLHLFPNPSTPLTFAFTPFANIDLSAPANKAWKSTRCMIAVKNNDKAQAGRWTLNDLAATARRITQKCVFGTSESVGGLSNIGTSGGGFYVYVGGLLEVEELESSVANLTGVASS